MRKFLLLPALFALLALPATATAAPTLGIAFTGTEVSTVVGKTETVVLRVTNTEAAPTPPQTVDLAVMQAKGTGGLAITSSNAAFDPTTGIWKVPAVTAAQPAELTLTVVASKKKTFTLNAKLALTDYGSPSDTFEIKTRNPSLSIDFDGKPFGKAKRTYSHPGSVVLNAGPIDCKDISLSVKTSLKSRGRLQTLDSRKLKLKAKDGGCSFSGKTQFSAAARGLSFRITFTARLKKKAITVGGTKLTGVGPVTLVRNVKVPR